jgi:hypothetical protein
MARRCSLEPPEKIELCSCDLNVYSSHHPLKPYAETVTSKVMVLRGRDFVG